MPIYDRAGTPQYAGRVLQCFAVPATEFRDGMTRVEEVRRPYAKVWETDRPLHLALLNGEWAAVDATPEVVAAYDAWTANEAERIRAYDEALAGCVPRMGVLALVCEGPGRGVLVLPDVLLASRTPRAATRSCCGVCPDLLEVTGAVERDVPGWGASVSVVANKSRTLGYATTRRLAAEPELLRAAEAHGRIRIDMGARTPPASWFRRNNELYGLEPRNR